MISDKHKFIFILLPKTGTTSIISCGRNKYGFSITPGVDQHYVDVNENRLNYFKVATCRNPFPRVVSLWKYWSFRNAQARANHSTTDFLYFVKNYTKMQKKICHHFDEREKIHFCSCIDGVAISTDNRLSYTDIDFWIKTETLQQDFNIVCDKIGIPQQQLPHVNKTNHTHYTEYYDDETREIVAERYAKDIEHFGYEFGK